MKIKTNVQTSKFLIKGKYSDFSDFYGVNKVEIYRELIKLFNEFKKEEVSNIVLNVSSKINGFNFKTKLNFKREEINILLRDIKPYFEEIEDYETCGKIINLHKELSLV